MAAGAEPDLGTLLRRHGVSPLSPPVAAADFELPELGGGRSALADHAGNWIQLTFWASWCGPCRSEMPSLERLHRSHAARGWRVVGVSSDRQVEAALRFARDYRLSFVNFWDERGEVTARYRAEAIPTSYLIDPHSRVVGVAHGARDWEALTPLVDGLLAAIPPAKGNRYRSPRPAERSDSGGEGDLYLSPFSPFAPPAAEWRVDPAPVAGEPFELEITVRWAGRLDEYLLAPPRVELPEGVQRLGVSARSTSEGGRELVIYRFELAAAEPGSYDLDPLELSYTPRLGSGPVVERLDGPTVVVAPRAATALRPAVLAAAVAGAGALTAGAAIALRRRRAAPAPAGADEAAVARALAAGLEQARRRRLEGDAAGAALELARVESRLAGETDPGLVALIERVRYGGGAPSAQELADWQRRLERRLAEEAARTAAPELELRDQEG